MDSYQWIITVFCTGIRLQCQAVGKQAMSNAAKKTCRGLAQQSSSTPCVDSDIVKLECDVCSLERESKHLVLRGEHDPRLDQENFRNAPAIFANNDIKYDTNKQRAKKYAQLEGKGISYACAKDTPSQEALQERPDLPAQKRQWLNR